MNMDEMLTAIGIDVEALPDRLETTMLKAVCDKLGVDTSDMTDNLVTSYLEQIALEYAGGGGGSEDLSEVLDEQEALISELQRIISRKVDKSEEAWNDVTFIDYDGTVLYSYTTAEAKALTEMPPLPTQPGLVCQGWNYDLETVKSYDTPVTVGATYITDDGKTRIYITLHEGRTSPMLGCRPNGTVTVDWGDGSEPDVLTGTSTSSSSSNVKWTPAHNYAAPGDYVIRLAVEGTVALAGSSTANERSYLLRYSSEYSTINNGYQSRIKKIEIGSNVLIGDYAFNNCYSLSSITLPNSVTSFGNNSFDSCYSLSSITLPNSVTSVNNNAFNNCYSLSSIAIPNSVTSFSGTTFYNCYSLSSITIPNSVTSIATAFCQKCYSLSSITIPNSVTSVGGNAFNNCYSIRFVDFSSHTSVPTLANTSAFTGIATDCEIRVPAALYDEWIAATNWSTYASKIVAV